MLEVTNELCLRTYFLFQKLGGKIFKEEKALLKKLAEIFLLTEKEGKELLRLTKLEIVAGIATYSDYAQFCRIRQYLVAENVETALSDEALEVVALKGEALRATKECEGEEYGTDSPSLQIRRLEKSAETGVVDALCTLGFLQCEGYFGAKRKAEGKKNLSAAAKWNSLAGILLSLFYDEENRHENANRLYTVVKGERTEEILTRAMDRYKTETVVAVHGNQLLKQCFAEGSLDERRVDWRCPRLLYSPVLNDADKVRALSEKGNGLLFSELMNLPLEIFANGVAFDEGILEELTIFTKENLSRIVNHDFRADCEKIGSRPLCIEADTGSVLYTVSRIFEKGFPNAHIEKIDFAELHDYQLEPTAANCFLAGCEEGINNVTFIMVRGQVSSVAMNELKKFLQWEKRKKFRLARSGVTLDLSAVLPVCFCDTENARELSPYCDVVTLPQPTEKTRGKFVEFILADKAKTYDLESVSGNEEAMQLLASFSVERVASLADDMLRHNVAGKQVVFTVEMVRESSKNVGKERNRCGFGGNE